MIWWIASFCVAALVATEVAVALMPAPGGDLWVTILWAALEAKNTRHSVITP
jgi:hypothetical protein